MAEYSAIVSERLELKCLTPSIIHAIFEDDADAIADSLGLAGPTTWPGDRTVLELRLKRIESDASAQPFLLRAMVHRETRELVGHIGFHETPNAQYLLDLGLKGLEFGYTVFEPFRRRGYAKEASAALMQWAGEAHGINDFVLSIAPTNEPSLRLAKGLGFTYHSVYNDPADGVEHVYTGKYPKSRRAQSFVEDFK